MSQPPTPRPTVLLRLILIAAVLAAALSPAATPATAAPRVIGGQPAADGAWPGVVALVRAEEPDDVAGQLCGGTAIAADLVLTAAHCVHDAAGAVTRTGDQIRVIAGRTDLRDPGGVELQGAEIYVHPAFDARRHRNDVAVLRVIGDLGVPGQPLAGALSAGPFEGDRAVVVGWGRTGSGDEAASRRTARLQEATVEVLGDRACRAAFDGTTDLRVQLCAGGGGSADAPAADACTGDSGGPLLTPDPDGTWVQVGITSYGPATCGVGDPGVFSRLSALRDFVDRVGQGEVPPTIAPGALLTPVRDGTQAIRIDDPTALVTGVVDQAVASSRALFDDGRAELALLARDDAFPDALAGSTLGFGRGPLLFTPSTGPLPDATSAELRRALQPGSTVYLLGGTAAVPVGVEAQLAAMGFTPHRLAGAVREATAVAVADEVVARHGGGAVPFGTAVLVTSVQWPDAVLSGQLGAWWGVPILLTPPDHLHPVTAEVIARLDVRRLLVVGGSAAVSDVVVDQVVADAAAAGRPLEVQRLAGSTRVGTGVAVAEWHRRELQATGGSTPDAVVAVNVRRPDGYAHVLAATPILGATAGVFLPVDGDAGDVLVAEVVASFCGVGGLPIVAGGADLVTDEVVGRLAGLLAGTDCDQPVPATTER